MAQILEWRFVIGTLSLRGHTWRHTAESGCVGEVSRAQQQ